MARGAGGRKGRPYGTTDTGPRTVGEGLAPSRPVVRSWSHTLCP